jgi:flagellar assembly factor FliW
VTIMCEETVTASPSGGHPILDFVEPIPGFPEEREFVLAPLDPTGTLFALRSLRTPGLRFIVMPPAVFFPDYHPAVDEGDVSPLALGDSTDLQVLVIVSVQDGIGDATVNLRAPIVLATDTGRAMQLILDDARWPLHAPLVAAAS